MTTYAILLLGVITLACSIPGHAQQFGSHRPPQQIDTFSEFPEPELFWNVFIRNSKPVLLKYVLRTAPFPPYRLWTDAYLKKNCGDVMVRVHYTEADSQTTSATLLEFLDMYKDVNARMELNVPLCMHSDVYIPRSIQCGGMEYYIDTITLELSSHKRNSGMYIEELTTFRCLLAGNEDIILIDRMLKGSVEADGWFDSSSSVDVEKVDMEKYPELKGLPFYKISLKAGDCVFIPQHWYREVNSFGGRHFAINIMSTHVNWFNRTDCLGVNTSEPVVPFRNYNFTSDFRNDNIRFLHPLLDQVLVSRNEFLNTFAKPDIGEHIKDEVIRFVDINGDSKLSWEELLSLDVRLFMNTYPDYLKSDSSVLDDIDSAMFQHDEL